MGGRLSVPKSPNDTSELSKPVPPPPPPPHRRRLNINSRTVVAPAAAFVMALLLYVYSTSSIRAAKQNARKHREADGGQINWGNESLRRHGVLEKPEDEGVWRQIFAKKEEEREKEKEGEGAGRDRQRVREALDVRAEGEEKLRAAMGKRKRDGG